MFDEVCSELRDTIHDALVDLLGASDMNELSPMLAEIADGCNIVFTDDGLAIVCRGAETYGISIQKV